MEEIDTSGFKDMIFPKTKFSMVIPDVEEQLRTMENVKSVVLMGIEVRMKILENIASLIKIMCHLYIQNLSFKNLRVLKI